MKKLLFGLGAVSAIVVSGLSKKKPSLNILPQFGEMTRRQFLDWINPENKFHPSDAYSRMSIDSENNPFTKVGLFDTIGFVYLKGQRFSFEKLKTEEDTFVIWENISRNWRKPDYRVKMLMRNGILYWDNRVIYNRFKDNDFFWVNKRFDESDHIKIPILKRKQIKYLQKMAVKLVNLPKIYEEEYPYILEEFSRKGEVFQIRAKREPQNYQGDQLVLFNSKMQKIGASQDEWGTTLIMLAKEYRGYSLGKDLFKAWYRFNPNYDSGGFTTSGYNLSLSVWKDRVKELEKKGFYQSFPDQEKAEEILEQANKLHRPKKQLPVLKQKINKADLLFHKSSDSFFVVYHRRFFEELDPKWIVGYVFFRENRYGDFIYQIDYEPEYRELVTLSALQFARDEGYKLFYGNPEFNTFLDLVELEGLDWVVKQADHIYLPKDVLPLKQWFLFSQEAERKQYPSRVDRLVFSSSLEELAFSKWVYHNVHRGVLS